MGIQQEHINKAIALAKQFGVTRLIQFGSSLEHPATARDLDLACDGIPGWELFRFAAQLEEELNIPTDIIPLSPPTKFTELISRRGKVLL